MKTDPQEQLIAAPREKRDIWDQFRHDHELITRLKITSQELDALAKCALLGTLACKQDFLFILRQIREATSPANAQAVVWSPPPDAHEDSIEEPAPDLGRIRQRLANPRAVLSEPASLGGIARRRVPEQFGVTFWAVVLVAGLMWNFAIAISRWREAFMSSIGAPATYSSPSATWYAKIDDFNMLIGWEILFVGVVAAVIYLRSRKRSSRFKVKPI